MGERRSAFLAEHKRRPTPDEERQLAEAEREDRRQEERDRREGEVRRSYLKAGGTAEEWERAKGELLEKDRRERALAERDAGRAEQARILRSVF